MISQRNNEQTKIVPPEGLCCPLTKQLFKQPVIALSNGKTYEKDAIEKLYDKVKGVIVLPDKQEIENKFIPDNAMKKKVNDFLKENPSYVRPITEEIKNNFVAAVTKDDIKQMELLVSEEPMLLSEKLFANKTVLQHLAEPFKMGTPSLICILRVAKTKWQAAVWNTYFENHIVNGGKSNLIIAAIMNDTLNVNSRDYSDGNTLLHLATKSGHKELVERLIIECNADTYLKNNDGARAKDVAPQGSGVAQLIKDSLNKKALEQVFKPREKELNEKIVSQSNNIRKLEDQNVALSKELSTTKLLIQGLGFNMKEHDERIKKLETKNAAVENRLQAEINRTDKLAAAHANLVNILREKGLFRMKGYFVSIMGQVASIEEAVERGFYEEYDPAATDTYATLNGGRYRPVFYHRLKFTHSTSLPREEEEREYRKCLLL
jgi:hypothetical protein